MMNTNKILIKGKILARFAAEAVSVFEAKDEFGITEEEIKSLFESARTGGDKSTSETLSNIVDKCIAEEKKKDLERIEKTEGFEESVETLMKILFGI